MKNVLITGASGGIGLAAVRRFLREGFTVFAQYHRNADGLAELSEAYPGQLIALQADLSEPAEVRTLFDKIRSLVPGLDVLVNNAGVAYFGLLQYMSVEEWDALFNLNLRAAFLCVREALPAMIAAHAGVILNVSSMWGERGASCEVAYSASKGGLNAFTKALAKEVGPSGIRVNALSCGVIDTRMNARLNEEERRELAECIGLNRFGTPEEAAEAIYWLCSGQASYVSGSILDIDGCFL